MGRSYGVKAGIPWLPLLFDTHASRLRESTVCISDTRHLPTFGRSTYGSFQTFMQRGVLLLLLSSQLKTVPYTSQTHDAEWKFLLGRGRERAREKERRERESERESAPEISCERYPRLCALRYPLDSTNHTRRNTPIEYAYRNNKNNPYIQMHSFTSRTAGARMNTAGYGFLLAELPSFLPADPVSSADVSSGTSKLDVCAPK